uniref:Uncharacterized protein n=1 Tax=Spongospora subterranea TaxID=70186 RepID=A0A0H5QS37_9EUKA|eukprot:CRZ04780.1 hypothetical protein [Spongospora subterranea]
MIQIACSSVSLGAIILFYSLAETQLNNCPTRCFYLLSLKSVAANSTQQRNSKPFEVTLSGPLQKKGTAVVHYMSFQEDALRYINKHGHYLKQRSRNVREEPL